MCNTLLLSSDVKRFDRIEKFSIVLLYFDKINKKLIKKSANKVTDL